MDRLERFYKIHDRLQSGRPVAATTLRRELEVSRATLMRDLRYMRLFFQAPIEYDRRGQGGYRYNLDAGKFELPGVWLSESELWSMLAASELLDGLRAGFLAEEVAPLQRRLRQMLETMGYDLGQVAGRVIARPQGARSGDPRVFLTVSQAVMKQQRLDLKYHARYNDQVRQRQVDPQRLLYHRDNWYLLCWCLDAKAWRVLACDRIREAGTVGKSKHKISDKEFAALTAEGFGMFLHDDAAEGVQWASLRVSPDAAKWVRDETWHAQQKLSELPNGGLRLQVPYVNPRELILEILRLGDDVEVESPAKLRQQVADKLKKAVKQYR